MATTSAKIDEHPTFLHADKIVCRLDLFPELLQALGDGDLLTGRLVCAQLFDFDGRRNLPTGERASTLQAANKITRLL